MGEQDYSVSQNNWCILLSLHELVSWRTDFCPNSVILVTEAVVLHKTKTASVSVANAVSFARGQPLGVIWTHLVLQTHTWNSLPLESFAITTAEMQNYSVWSENSALLKEVVFWYLEEKPETW